MGSPATSAPAEAAAANQPPRLFEDRIKELAGWAGMAYGLGFLCILVQTARYGIQVIEVIKPLNFWVGFVPTLTIFFTVMAWEKKLRDLTLKAQDRKSDLVNRATPPVASVLRFLATGILRGLQRLRLKIRYQFEQGGLEKWAGFLLNFFVVAASLFASYSGQIVAFKKRLPPGILRTLGILALGVLFLYITDWLGRLFKNHANLRFAFLFSLALGFIVYYIGFVYPYIPQEIGGGWPAKVQLVVEAEAFQDSPLERDGLLTRQGQAKTALTPEVCLLYRTADVYILDFSCSLLSPNKQRRVISVPDRHVRAILWKGRPAYERVPWFMDSLRRLRYLWS